MKMIKHFIILASSILLASCAVNTVNSKTDIPAPPTQTESLRPNIDKTEENIGIISNQNQSLKDKIKDEGDIIDAQKIDISSSIEQADNIKNQISSKKAVTIKQATDLVDELKKIEARNLFLEKENDTLSKLSQSQKETISTTSTIVTELSRKISANENELSILRSQNSNLSIIIKSRDKDVQALQIDNHKLTITASSASVYKHWIIGIVAAFVLWTIIKNVLMIYLPTSRFRL